MKRTAVFLVLIIQFIFVPNIFAHPPEITNGINYLSTTQNPDGSWGSDTSDEQITELSEANNIGSVAVQVDGVQVGADLSTTAADITLTPFRPCAGDTVQIAARIRNLGTEDALNFTVEFFDGAPESGGTLIYSQALSLSSGEDQPLTTDWIISDGIHDLYVIVDRDNQIVEMDEANNRTMIRVMMDMIDISVSATDLVFTPSWPVVGDAVRMTTRQGVSIRLRKGSLTLWPDQKDITLPAGLYYEGSLIPVTDAPEPHGDGRRHPGHTLLISLETYSMNGSQRAHGPSLCILNLMRLEPLRSMSWHQTCRVLIPWILR
jgi:hypothetical protein